MKRLRIIAKDADQQAVDEPHIVGAALPLFYMSDYSVTGLAVGRLEKTAGVLEAEGFSVNRRAVDNEVAVDNLNAMLHIFQLLRDHDIEFEMTDLVDRVYQG